MTHIECGWNGCILPHDPSIHEPRLPFITAKEFGDREALKDVLATLAASWEREARPLLIVRSMLQNTEGWTLQRCAADLRLAAGIPNPDALRAVEDNVL